MTSLDILFFLSALLCGLLAGLFYGYDCSVIRGLGNLKDKAYLSAFQSINKAILNPWFFASFAGSLIVLPVTAWVSYGQASMTSFYLVLGAGIVYAVAVFGVTVARNVPLNERLAAADLNTLTDADITKMREHFEKTWNFYHRIRTIASIVSFSLVLLSIFRR